MKMLWPLILSTPAYTGCQSAGDMIVRAPQMAVCAVTSTAFNTVRGVTTPPKVAQPAEHSRHVSDHDIGRLTELYDRCEYEECEKQADLILANSRASTKQRAVACLYKGVVRQLEGEESQARACFQRMYAMNRAIKIETRRFKPAVVESIRAAQR